LEDCPQTQAQKKCLYLEAHAFNALSSVLSAEVKDLIEMEYGFPESANLLWKALEEIYGLSNIEESSMKIASENISSSTELVDQDQEEQSRMGPPPTWRGQFPARWWPAGQATWLTDQVEWLPPTFFPDSAFSSSCRHVATKVRVKPPQTLVDRSRSWASRLACGPTQLAVWPT
jgi:hypothetical protein